MRITIISFIALLISAYLATAENPKAVTKEEAIAAIIEYRTGVKLITAIHTDLMQESMLDDPANEIFLSEAQINKYKQARKHLQKSISLNPYFPDAYLYLANSYWEIENNLQKTIEYYSKALDIDPDYDDVISARAQVFLLLKQLEDARKDLVRLEAIDSDHAESLRAQIAELEK